MTQIWKCEFCNVKEMQRGTLNKHERGCRLNPKNKLCFTCTKFTPGSKTCEEGIKVSMFTPPEYFVINGYKKSVPPYEVIILACEKIKISK
jgi:hypothetical protein